MISRMLKILVVGSTLYLAKELNGWYDGQWSNQNTASTSGFKENVPASEIPIGSDTPREMLEEVKAPVQQRLLFDEEDKRRLKRAQEDMEKKACTKSGLCEPTPKPITESINDALYDTWLALKKVPSYWSRAADQIGGALSRLFGSDK